MRVAQFYQSGRKVHAIAIVLFITFFGFATQTQTKFNNNRSQWTFRICFQELTAMPSMKLNFQNKLAKNTEHNFFFLNGMQESGGIFGNGARYSLILNYI